MPTAILTTTADDKRPGLTYKIDIPSWGMDTWYNDHPLLKGQRRSLASEADLAVLGIERTANTSITVIGDDGKLQSHAYWLTWEQVHDLLQLADYGLDDYSRGSGKPGRPEKRVLIMTTSKERRLGATVAKTTY